MRTKILPQLFSITLMLAMLSVVVPAWTQDRPSDNMEILREKIRADKKLLVAVNMGLTQTEAKGFWPIYEEYQTDQASQKLRSGLSEQESHRREGTEAH